MPVYEFGSGTMWGIPTVTLAGNNVTTPTPVPFGKMQDVSIEFSQGVKELYGLYKYPIDVAGTTGKISGKAKVAQIQALLFNSLLFGETLSANEIKVAYREAANTGNANSVTPSYNGASVFLYDLGVSFNSTGLPLTRGANAANNGIYSVDANGTYLFGVGDANKAVNISYAYVGNGAAANQFIINNQLLGLQTFFKGVFSINRAGKFLTIVLNRCVATKLSFATKLEDFVIPEFDFSAMADASDQVGTISVTEG